MSHLHLPVQHGSDRILMAMKRGYTAMEYKSTVRKLRYIRPELVMSSDFIVGFPGESDEDFQATLDVVRQARFTAAYTFQYSKRPGTPAATMLDQIPADLVAQRYTALHALQQEISGDINQASVGKSYEVLVSDHEGRHDQSRSRLNGRTPDFRLVHFEAEEIRPGDLATITIESASPNFMVGSLQSVRATRGGDAFDARTKESGPTPLMLGMPTLKALKLLSGS